MRIARVLTRLNLGGPARQVLGADPLLSARGHTLRVFTGRSGPGEGDLCGALEARGIEVVRVPALARGIAPRDLWAVRALRGELARFGPDIVHTHASKAGALGRRAALALNVPTVHTFHGHVLEGYFPGPIERTFRALERRLARRTQRIVAVSHATADDLIRLGIVPEERVTVVPPGIDLGGLTAIRARSSYLRRLIGAGEEALLVGIVGRLAPVKRPELALEVFDLLAERYPALHLVFVGDGEGRRALERRIQGGREAVQRRVHMVGAQPNMVAVLADLDVVLSCSRSEGLPVALIEAGAAGLPVVATPVGGVGELVVHERTGWLGEDAVELAYGLAQLLDDARLRADMGHRARVRVTARHGAETLADRLEALYRAVLSEATCVS